MKEFHAACRRAVAIFLGLTGVVASAAPLASAQQQPPQAMSIAPSAPRPPAPPASRGRPAGVQKYEDAATQRSFVVDRTGDETLMRMEDSPEVFALRSTTAQRGDAFLRNDTGQLMLRVTEQGNVISYIWDKDGVPADVSGAANPLSLPQISDSLNERRKAAAATLKRLAGHDVTIFGTSEFANQEAWAVDALTVLEIGVQRAADASGVSVQALKAVRLSRAPVASVTFGPTGELVLGVNPGSGYAGRPSSEAVAAALAAATVR